MDYNLLSTREEKSLSFMKLKISLFYDMGLIIIILNFIYHIFLCYLGHSRLI